MYHTIILIQPTYIPWVCIILSYSYNLLISPECVSYYHTHTTYLYPLSVYHTIILIQPTYIPRVCIILSYSYNLLISPECVSYYHTHTTYLYPLSVYHTIILIQPTYIPRVCLILSYSYNLLTLFSLVWCIHIYIIVFENNIHLRLRLLYIYGIDKQIFDIQQVEQSKLRHTDLM